VPRAQSVFADPAQRLLPPHVSRAQGRLAMARGDTTAAVDALERARLAFDAVGARYEVAVTDLALAEALSRAGRSRDAIAAVESATPVVTGLRSRREIEQATLLRRRLT
jgi:hypothetical protein